MNLGTSSVCACARLLRPPPKLLVGLMVVDTGWPGPHYHGLGMDRPWIGNSSGCISMPVHDL